MRRRVILALLLVAPALAAAQPYRWTDEKGVVRYGDTPPPKARNVQKLPAAPRAAGEPQPPFELARLQRDYPVKLYTSPTCKEPCELAREALNRRGVPFSEVQVWNPETNEELKRVSGANDVPVLVVGRSVQRGFEQGAFDLLLDSAGYPKAGVLPPGRQKAPPPPEGYVPPHEREGAKPLEPEPAQPPAPRGRYDPSGLAGPAPKPGRYVLPGQSP